VTPRPGYLAPPETAVLTPAQVAQWLQVSERQLDRLDGLPWFEVGGKRSRRVAVSEMLKWIAQQSQRKAG
jgi:hypothetical protein